MSVVAGLREEGELQVLLLIKELTVYTVRVCTKEKYYPKSSRWVYARRIVDETIEAYQCVRRANTVRLPTKDTPWGRDAYRDRYRDQRMAYAHLDTVRGLVQLSFIAYSLTGEQLNDWIGKIVEIENKLSAWMKSDKQRVSKIFKTEE